MEKLEKNKENLKLAKKSLIRSILIFLLCSLSLLTFFNLLEKHNKNFENFIEKTKKDATSLDIAYINNKKYVDITNLGFNKSITKNINGLVYIYDIDKIKINGKTYGTLSSFNNYIKTLDKTFITNNSYQFNGFYKKEENQIFLLNYSEKQLQDNIQKENLKMITFGFFYPTAFFLIIFGYLFIQKIILIVLDLITIFKLKQLIKTNA